MADFLKVVVYNNCGGERYQRFIENVGSTVFRDVPQGRAAAAQQPPAGLRRRGDAGGVARAPASHPTTSPARPARALVGVAGKCRILPGHRRRHPDGAGQPQGQPGGHLRRGGGRSEGGRRRGRPVSRKYSEMRLENLAAAGLRRPRFFRLIQGRAEFSGVGPALPVGHGRVCFTGEFADRECRSVPAGFLSTSLAECSLGSPDRLCHHGEWSFRKDCGSLASACSRRDLRRNYDGDCRAPLDHRAGPVEFIRFRARHPRRHADCARHSTISCPGFMVTLRPVPGGLAE